jgi:hypothetical protein
MEIDPVCCRDFALGKSSRVAEPVNCVEIIMPGYCVEIIMPGWLTDFLAIVLKAINENAGAITAIATAVIGLFTWRLWSATRSLGASDEKQIAIAREAADAAGHSANVAERALIAAHRPWIMADISVGGPIIYNVNGLNFTLRFQLKNIGRSPATNVWVKTCVFAPAIGVDSAMISPRARLNQLIAESKAARPTPFGYALFPDEVIVQDVTMGIGQEELTRITQVTEMIFPTVIGAIIYRSSFDERPHHTGFFVEVRRSEAPRPESIAKNRAPSTILRMRETSQKPR